MSTPPPFVTPEDIHEVRPDLSLETIRRHCRRGVIPGAVKVGRSWAVPATAAAAYVETYERHTQNRSPAPPQAPGSSPQRGVERGNAQ